MGHTPGPWRSTRYNAVLKSCNFFAIEAEDHTGMIAEVDDDTKDAEANARLIAQSPALLEVCKELLEEHYLFRKDNRLVCPFCMTESIADCPVNFPHSPDCPVIKARQVIAKAEGREA